MKWFTVSYLSPYNYWVQITLLYLLNINIDELSFLCSFIDMFQEFNIMWWLDNWRWKIFSPIVKQGCQCDNGASLESAKFFIQSLWSFSMFRLCVGDMPFYRVSEEDLTQFLKHQKIKYILKITDYFQWLYTSQSFFHIYKKDQTYHNTAYGKLVEMDGLLVFSTQQ